jgi:hypothetical protein
VVEIWRLAVGPADKIYAIADSTDVAYAMDLKGHLLKTYEPLPREMNKDIDYGKSNQELSSVNQPWLWIVTDMIHPIGLKTPVITRRADRTWFRGMFCTQAVAPDESTVVIDKEDENSYNASEEQLVATLVSPSGKSLITVRLPKGLDLYAAAFDGHTLVLETPDRVIGYNRNLEPLWQAKISSGRLDEIYLHKGLLYKWDRKETMTVYALPK